MCGFFSQYNTHNLPNSQFRQLLALGAHRGPDQTGVWEDESVQFGFNRLAILNLTDAGPQPMGSPQSGYVMLSNEEVAPFLK